MSSYSEAEQMEMLREDIRPALRTGLDFLESVDDMDCAIFDLRNALEAVDKRIGSEGDERDS